MRLGPTITLSFAFCNETKYCRRTLTVSRTTTRRKWSFPSTQNNISRCSVFFNPWCLNKYLLKLLPFILQSTTNNIYICLVSSVYLITETEKKIFKNQVSTYFIRLMQKICCFDLINLEMLKLVSILKDPQTDKLNSKSPNLWLHEN